MAPLGTEARGWPSLLLTTLPLAHWALSVVLYTCPVCPHSLSPEIRLIMVYFLQISTNGEPRPAGGDSEREGPLGLEQGAEIEAGRVEPLQIGVGPRVLMLLFWSYPKLKDKPLGSLQNTLICTFLCRNYFCYRYS